MTSIDRLIAGACKAGASDLHLAVGSLPMCRIHGRLQPMAPVAAPDSAPSAMVAVKGSEGYEAETAAGRVSGYIIEPSAGQIAEHPSHLSPDSAIRLVPEPCSELALSPTGLLTSKETLELAAAMMTEEQYQEFLAAGEYDFAYVATGICRCRVNVFKQRGHTSLALRLLNREVPSLTELGLPEVLATFCRQQRGLVLVTGATGSGKSTTLAAMVDLINDERSGHIITLEDPIEYLHRNKQCLISQREVGRDTSSFATALRAALREDPDVILVGEMRDPETIAIALTAAETGHLVLGTLHTVGAAQAVDRIINAFPPHLQQQARLQLGNTLLGVTAQSLLPRSDNTGRVVVMEILVATMAVRNLIREGKSHQLISQMQTGAKYGMQTMEGAVLAAYRQGLLSREVVIEQGIEPEAL